MLTLINNEFRKLITRKKTYVILLGFAAIMALLIFGKYKDNQNYERWNKPEAKLEQLKRSTTHMKVRSEEVEKLIANSTKEEEKAKLLKEKELYERDLKDLNESIKSLEESIKKRRKGRLESRVR